MTKRIAILISGGGSNMVNLVRSMDQTHPGRCMVVISNDPNAPGLQRAAELGIAPHAIDHRDFPDRAGFEAELQSELERREVELICLAGFMRILSADFVARWSGRMLNIHPSLLPKFKGLKTHERAIAAGDAHAGCSVHLVTPELDDGPILGQARLEIAPDETAQTLAKRVLKLEHRLYPQVLRRFMQGESLPIYLNEEEPERRAATE